MISHETRIKLDWGKPVTIFFFGDLQDGQPGFSKDGWEAFRDKFESTPRAYAIGLGDYSDSWRPTMRTAISQAVSKSDNEKRQLDDMFRRKQDDLLENIEFLSGKLIGLHTGHHEFDFIDGTNGTQRLCSALKAPYLGWMALTRVSLETPWKHHMRGRKFAAHNYHILSMHGSGNGRSIGSDVNWMMNNIFLGFGADCYAKGHSCKAVGWKALRKHPKMLGLPGYYDKVSAFIQVGGFHSGYTDGWNSSYVERAGFSPQPISWGELRIVLAQYSGEGNKREEAGIRSAFINADPVAVTPPQQLDE